MDHGSTKSGIPLTAIVLAGGQSARMGYDKALITIQGVPLLQQVCHLALQCTARVWVITPWPERYRDIAPSDCLLIQETPWPGESTLAVPHGPLLGFAQGLAQVQTDWVLLLACDLPRLQVAVLQSWIKELVEANPSSQPKTIAFLPRRAKGWEPLCGFYHRSCLPALTHFIDQGGRSFQRWLAQHQVQELPLANTQMLFNCNTPEDLDVLLKLSLMEGVDYGLSWLPGY